MRVHYLIITLIYVFCLCCNIKGDEYFPQEPIFLTLTIDSTISPFNYTNRLRRIDGNTYLYYENRDNDEVIVFDLYNDVIDERIRFNRSGPDAIDAFQGFTISENGNVIISDLGDVLKEVDTNGKVIKRMYYSITESRINYSRPSAINSNMANDIYSIDGTTIIPQEPIIRSNKGALLSQEEIIKSKLFIRLSNDTPEYLPIGLDDTFFDNLVQQMGMTTMSSCYDGDKLVWGFSCVPTLYSTANMKVIASHNGASNNVSNILDPFKSGPYEFYQKSDLYKSIIYDDYRKCFYRLIRIGSDDAIDDISIVDNAKFPQAISIQQFSKDLQFIGEFLLTSKYYNINQYLVLSDGFYLSINSPLNKEFDENKITFQKIL